MAKNIRRAIYRSIFSCSDGVGVSQEGEREYILAVARELYGRAFYSHKTHEKERVIWSSKACTMNRINIVLVSLTTVFAVFSAALPQPWALITTAVIAAAT